MPKKTVFTELRRRIKNLETFVKGMDQYVAEWQTSGVPLTQTDGIDFLIRKGMADTAIVDLNNSWQIISDAITQQYLANRTAVIQAAQSRPEYFEEVIATLRDPELKDQTVLEITLSGHPGSHPKRVQLESEASEYLSKNLRQWRKFYSLIDTLVASEAAHVRASGFGLLNDLMDKTASLSTYLLGKKGSPPTTFAQRWQLLERYEPVYQQHKEEMLADDNLFKNIYPGSLLLFFEVRIEAFKKGKLQKKPEISAEMRTLWHLDESRDPIGCAYSNLIKEIASAHKVHIDVPGYC